LKTRLNQGWLDEYYDTLDKLIPRLREAMNNKENVSIGYLGNIVDLWERLYDENIKVDIGTDQTSLHNPYQGGYYPAGLTYEESNELMSKNPELFKQKVHESLKRQVAIINKHAQLGMYFFDYGNAFLLESSRAGADILLPIGEFKYPSYVQDIMGPQFFDFGFGPFRWVCTSGDPADLDKTDKIAGDILEEMYQTAPDEIKLQLSDSIDWIRNAKANKLVVGSQARILYAD
jgi:urocanate hydratase